jgi:hypothetical protein
MTTAIAGASFDSLPPKEKAALRHAMLSVYYLSVGSQLESRGAPVMAVPPDVRPLPLDAALAKLKNYDSLRWDAYWRIVRSVPVEAWKRRSLERRYPQALVDELGLGEVEALDKLRKHARLRAHFFTGALLSCAEGHGAEAIALAEMLEHRDGIRLEQDDPGDLSVSDGQWDVVDALREATKAVLGKTAVDYITCIAGSEDAQQRTREELRRLQSEVGIGLGEFIEDFFDTVAFQSFRKRQGGPSTVLISSCIVRQDTNTLTTTATVTTLATATLEQLSTLIDPLAWPRNSDVIEDTWYVGDPWDPDTKDQDQSSREFAPPGRKLFEDVSVRFGFDEAHSGGFKNVLTIDKFTKDPRDGITLPFRLCRSVDSRIFWDARAGGILIDGGFIVARPVLGHVADDGEVVPIENRWRVTTRKVLRFSDRTPYANASGWLDFGQLLNYLVPAAVTLWLETDFYGAESLNRTGGAPGREAPTRQTGKRDG